MPPDLQGSLACEDVRMELHGAQTLVGVISAVVAPSVPVRLLKFCIWSRWCSGAGEFTQEARVVCPDEDKIVCQNSITFKLANMDAHATNVHFFAGVQFDQHGVYHVEIRLDGELRLRYPVGILAGPAPAQA